MGQPQQGGVVDAAIAVAGIGRRDLAARYGGKIGAANVSATCTSVKTGEIKAHFSGGFQIDTTHHDRPVEVVIVDTYDEDCHEELIRLAKRWDCDLVYYDRYR